MLSSKELGNFFFQEPGPVTKHLGFGSLLTELRVSGSQLLLAHDEGTLGQLQVQISWCQSKASSKACTVTTAGPLRSTGNSAGLQAAGLGHRGRIGGGICGEKWGKVRLSLYGPRSAATPRTLVHSIPGEARTLVHSILGEARTLVHSFLGEARTLVHTIQGEDSCTCPGWDPEALKQFEIKSLDKRY